jgi:hypothetical protein
MNKIICSLEEWDSVIDYHRPNGASKSWYLKELGELNRPLMWGNWDLFNENGEFFSSDFFKGKISPNIYSTKIEYQTIDKIQNNKHIYIINIYNVSFFYEFELEISPYSASFFSTADFLESSIAMRITTWSSSPFTGSCESSSAPRGLRSRKRSNTLNFFLLTARV